MTNYSDEIQKLGRETRMKTLDELRESRLAVNVRQVAFQGNEMTVRLTLDNEMSEVEGLGSRLYTAEEVADLQASEAELIAAPLRRRIEDLEGELRDARAGWSASALRVDELQRQAHLYDVDRKTEKRRADDNKAWDERAEAHVTRLENSLADAEAAVQELAQVIGKINGAVHSPEILIALARLDAVSKVGDYLALANTVRRVRQITGSYSPPAPPASETSQA